MTNDCTTTCLTKALFVAVPWLCTAGLDRPESQMSMARPPEVGGLHTTHLPLHWRLAAGMHYPEPVCQQVTSERSLGVDTILGNDLFHSWHIFDLICIRSQL